MIHIAPCGCELHVRIRELEEQLSNKLTPTAICDHERGMCNHFWLIDRAERAESEAKRLAERNIEIARDWNHERGEHESRIKNLEKERDTALYQAGRMTRAEWNAKHMEPSYPEPLDTEQERLHAQEDE